MTATTSPATGMAAIPPATGATAMNRRSRQAAGSVHRTRHSCSSRARLLLRE